MEYLGYFIDPSGIRPTENHLNTVKNISLPKNQKELQTCIGLFSYYRKFVQSFSTIAIPLLDLLRKDVKFHLSEECIKAFNYFKKCLIEQHVLSIYFPKKGAILRQKQDDEKFHTVAFFSKSTTHAESRYHSFELETLAIIYVLRRFRVYLEGINFTIITDCNSLAMTLNRKQ